MSPGMQSSSRSPLGKDIQRYVRYKRALGRRYLIEESALRMLDRFLRERQVVQVSGVDPALIEAFLASRRRRTARSHNHLLGVLRCFFEWLVVQERIVHSPVRIGPRRTGPRPMPFLFDPVRAKRLLDIARALPDRPKGPGPISANLFSALIRSTSIAGTDGDEAIPPVPLRSRSTRRSSEPMTWRVRWLA